MNLLAIETATEVCSVALSVDGALLSRGEFAPRRHAELLLPMCQAVLAEAGLSRSDIDVVAVGRGPGAFTGVRLAIAAAQGIALARDVPIVPVSSLAALAMQAPDNGAATLAVIDARMGEIYAACFVRDRHCHIEPLGEETVGPSAAITLIERPPIESPLSESPLSESALIESRLADAARWNVIGSGWASDAATISRKLPCAPVWADAARYPQATDVARIALPLARAGLSVDAAQALPVYLRDKVALTSVEQRAAKAAMRSA